MPRCLQQYLRSCLCHITNFKAANLEMFRVNTFVTELLVLFHIGENGQNKQVAEEIHSFPSLRWLNRVMQDLEARASDLNQKLIFLFFLLFS